MLDTETQIVKKPAKILQGKRILVLGACCGFGRSMARALAASGAQVVAADSDTDGLKQIKGIVPITLKGAPDEALRRIGRTWAEARLDAVLNLMPLRHSDKIDLNISVLQGLVQGFMPALGARDGQIVSVVARPEQSLDVATGAMAPALLSAQAAFAHALRRDGIRLNMINVGENAVRPARTAVVGLLSGSLGPVSGSELRL
ncbi:SDR family NAD(P)-dependent oxidoreductase [Sulfitobacter sp. S223]|uniref:SDR family NAD(P)-dependent oxidoreductase n=1 Tax=Sulfitobacter sp. S223 TaxID=2867023 RepID=UPI0021A2FF77|nr:SDR family NAD(P)-dependent oxidoreductase [Sulfitobacter sp. S223]UWR27804.1 SDR family NAD(P)-dependent oxidoreductase [Sulfitobacter sp. S223]